MWYVNTPLFTLGKYQENSIFVLNIFSRPLEKGTKDFFRINKLLKYIMVRLNDMRVLKKWLNLPPFFLFIFICILFSPSYAWPDGLAKNIYGRIEYITLDQNTTLIKAKLDTGARISSLSAINIKYFKKFGQKWIAFDVVDPKKKTVMHFEKPLVRMLHIKPRHDESNIQTGSSRDKAASNIKRPVIKINICLRNQLKEIEVNLIDRSNFLYPMLLGSNSIILFDGLINPDAKFTERPSCNPVLDNINKDEK